MHVYREQLFIVENKQSYDQQNVSRKTSGDAEQEDELNEMHEGGTTTLCVCDLLVKLVG